MRGGGADQCLDGSLYHKNSERLGRCCWAVMVRDEGWVVLVAVVCLTSSSSCFNAQTALASVRRDTRDQRRIRPRSEYLLISSWAI